MKVQRGILSKKTRVCACGQKLVLEQNQSGTVKCHRCGGVVRA